MIRCIPENKVYYGVRYAQGCDPKELFNTYFTSSKVVHALIEQYGTDQFETSIRKTFDCSKKAREWEYRVLQRCNVVHNESFLNQTDHKSIDPKCAGWRKGLIGELHNRYGSTNPKLAELNRAKVGNKNPMFGKRGELAPGFGRTGSKHPMFGKKNPKASLAASIKYTCNTCGKVSNQLNIRRWHNGRCKGIGE